MYIVMTATARMPGGVRSPYRRVAVVETDGTVPKMISPRARGVVRIVQTWERLNVGKGTGQRSRPSAYAKAVAEAHALADQLNRRKEAA